MMKNDYRRSLILLRGSAPGYSGHVRLERRTLMGCMYFMLQVPEGGGELSAVLVGRGRGSYDACVLGELRQDGKGQASLSHSFDPRNICGRELEQYQLIAVAEKESGGCRIVLTGNVDGHADLNWERVRQAVCLSLNPAPEELPATPQPREEVIPEEQIVEEQIIYEEEIRAEESVPEEEMPVQEFVVEERIAPQEEALPQTTAGEVLGVNMDVLWPDSVEELRSLFASKPPLENPPDGEAVYISIPTPEGSPYPYMAVGLRARDGMLYSAKYAIPAAYTAEVPAGLEEYEWIGDSNRGWWITEIELESGDRI